MLILEYNLWDVRRYWGGVTDEEWGEMLVRLAPLGAGSLDGPYRLRWLVSGEEFVPAGRDEARQWFRYWGWMEGQPVWVQGYSRLSVPLPGDVEGLPAFGLGGLDWTLADVRSDGAIAWTASDQGRHLLAIADHQEAVRGVYTGAEPLSGQFATDDLLVRPISNTGVTALTRLSKVELVDLATSSIHEVDGLALSMGFDEDGQQGAYYFFLFARPSGH